MTSWLSSLTMSATMSTQSTTTTMDKKISAILDEDQIVEEKVNRLMKIGFDKTITSEERFRRILAVLEEGLESEGDIHSRLDDMNVTPNELLTVAMREKKLEEPVGACGTVCHNTCEWCSDDDEDESDDDDDSIDAIATAAARWAVFGGEEEEEEEKEEETREEEDHPCATCGSQCISYKAGEEIHWLCEECYYRPSYSSCNQRYCDSHCTSCMGGGYDGSDEV